MGYTGKAPEVRYTQARRLVVNVRLATTIQWRDGTGGLIEKTEWHRIVFFDRLAEIVRDHVRGGVLLFVEGRLENRTWRDGAAIEHTVSEVIVSNYNGGQLQILTPKDAPAKLPEAKPGKIPDNIPRTGTK